MLNIAELNRLSESDNQGLEQLVKPLLEFYNFLCEKKGFKTELEAQDYLEKYLKDNESIIVKEFEKTEEVDAISFGEIATLPLKKLCDEIEYPDKEIFTKRYQYLMTTINLGEESPQSSHQFI